MNAWIRRPQRLLIDVLENRAVTGTEARQRVTEQIVLPIANGADAVNEYQASNAVSVPLRSKHCETAPP